MRRACWLASGFLGLLAGCQQAPEKFEQPRIETESAPDNELSDASRPFTCYIQEYCYQINFPDNKPLHIPHPTLEGRVFVGFMVDADLHISREYVQAVRLTWKKSGKPRFLDEQAADSARLQSFLPLVRPAIQALRIQRTTRADRSICALERWSVPVTLE